MPGEGDIKTAPPAGDAATPPQSDQGQKPARVEIPPELKPEFDSYANRAAEAAIKRAKAQWDAEQAEKAKLAEMSEVERLKAEMQKTATQLADLQAEKKYRDLLGQAKRTAKGFIPEEILSAVLDDAIEASGEDEFPDPAVVAKAAQERWDAYIAQVGGTGFAASQDAAGAQRKSLIPGGTPPSDADGFSRRRAEDIQAEIQRLARTKPREAKDLLERWKAFQAGGGRNLS